LREKKGEGEVGDPGGSRDSGQEKKERARPHLGKKQADHRRGRVSGEAKIPVLKAREPGSGKLQVKEESPCPNPFGKNRPLLFQGEKRTVPHGLQRGERKAGLDEGRGGTGLELLAKAAALNARPWFKPSPAIL